MQLYLTRFWKLEVQGQGVGRFVFPNPLSLASRWLPSVLTLSHFNVAIFCQGII